VEKVSLVAEADYRNVVIFPEKFDGFMLGSTVLTRKSLRDRSGFRAPRIYATGASPVVLFRKSDGTVKIYWGGADTYNISSASTATLCCARGLID
jgi:hypothetical protein